MNAAAALCHSERSEESAVFVIPTEGRNLLFGPVAIFAFDFPEVRGLKSAARRPPPEVSLFVIPTEGRNLLVGPDAIFVFDFPDVRRPRSAACRPFYVIRSSTPCVCHSERSEESAVRP